MDETVFYSKFSEVSTINKLNIKIRMKSAGEVLLEVTVFEKWAVCTFSFPVRLLDTMDLEKISLAKIAEIFSIVPFKVAFCIHDYEYDAKDVAQNYLDQIQCLKPALIYIVDAEGLSITYDETNLEGLPR